MEKLKTPHPLATAVAQIFRAALSFAESAAIIGRDVVHAAAGVIAERTAKPGFERDWALDFGAEGGGVLAGKKGEIKKIRVYPEVDVFKGEKLMAIDTFEQPGCGTLIRQVMIGQRPQFPKFAGTLTLFFSQNALGNGLRWGDCLLGESIEMTVEFLQDCEFQCAVFGKVRGGARYGEVPELKAVL